MTQTKAHYKSIVRILSAILAAVLLAGMLPSASLTAYADSDGMIRVKMTRLGSSVKSLTMTTVGGYTAGGRTIPSGSNVKVTLSGGELTLTADGSRIASGSKLTMNRNAGGTGTGVRFNSPSLGNLFCGDLTFSVSGSSIQTVLSIYIETYLYGVVPYEMSNSFPVEALKAQTIAARTYAMRAKRSSGSYDVTDNTSSQVFKGYNSAYTNAISAVDGTRGVVLMSGSSYAQCYYTASNGGQTESSANAWGGSGISYLTVKDDPYDRENPNSIIKAYSIPKEPGEKALASGLEAALISAAAAQLSEKGLSTDSEDIIIDEILHVEPHTPKYGEPSRTYTKLRFTLKITGKSASTGNEVDTEVEVDLGTYSKLQSMLNLSINSSDNEIVTVEEEDDCFRLAFSRYGHGIGLSQRGAQWMAKQYEMGYEEILSFYYPGTKQTKLELKEAVGSAAESEPQPTRAPVESEDGYTTLQEGDSGSAVKALQTRLKELGYFTGTPLGNYKTLTVSAVKAYQRAMGLNDNGIATPDLQKMIFAEQKPAASAKPNQTPEQTPTDGQTRAVVSLGSSSSRLNVRKSASTSSSVVGTLRHDTEVTVLAVSGDWRRIKAGSITGYVKADYLKTVSSSNPQEPETGDGGYATLQYGDSGEAVRRLQEQLRKLGFFAGNPLGNYKTLTVGAVQAYQEAMGLEADGVATPELQEMIFAGKLPEATKAPDAEQVGTTATVSLGSSSSRLNVRKSASTSSGIVGTIRHGTKVTVLESAGGWSRIQTGSMTGYVKSSYLIGASGALPTAAPTPQPTKAPDQTGGSAVVTLGTASSRLNVRKSPTTSSAVVGSLRHGAKATVLESEGSWKRISSGSITGYVMGSYLKMNAPDMPTATPQPESGSTADYAAAVISLSSSSSRLNVRKSASTSSAIVGSLRHGTTVSVISREGSWSRIQSGSMTGYVMTNYLKESVGSEPTAAPTQEPAPTQGASGYRKLSYGDTGDDVRALQKKLRELGYFDGELGGNYLRLTRAAVEAYQKANGWTVDGVATIGLQEEIFRASAGASSDANARVSVGSDSYLNLRKSASTGSDVLGRLKSGARVAVIGEEGDWYRIRTTSGLTGYAKKEFISKDE